MVETQPKQLKEKNGVQFLTTGLCLLLGITGSGAKCAVMILALSVSRICPEYSCMQAPSRKQAKWHGQP